MDTEDFIRWAFDDARTIEERYTTELLIDFAEQRWNVQHQTGCYLNFEEIREKQRQRFLNPAYQPEYTVESARCAAEVFPTLNDWSLQTWSYRDRPVRDLAVLRFLGALEKLSIQGDFTDLAVLTELPRLHTLAVGGQVCEDFRPLGRCRHLRSLRLTFGRHWPDLEGLGNLQQLEELHLNGNLLACPRGLSFPRVRQGGLVCTPLQVRSVRELPQFPACEFLILGGVERLDGIEALPRLRNLTVNGVVRDFAPLTELTALTCFTHSGARPLDLTPLGRLPSLLCAHFATQHTFGADKDPLRDLTPLMDSPVLREVHVAGCPPLEMEAATINAALQPWDDLLLAPEPRPVPRLRIIVAPQQQHPRFPDDYHGLNQGDLPDKGVRECEARWVARYATSHIAGRVGHEDWGKVATYGSGRIITVTVECFEVVEKVGLILEATREVLARLRYEYRGQFYIMLRVPPPEATPAQAELERRFRAEQEAADDAQRDRDNETRLEHLYLYQLKQQEGETVEPEEFAPPPPEPPPPAPWEVESEDDADDEDEEGSGNFAVKKRPDPPPSMFDDEHPLADNYRFFAYYDLGELWIDPRHAPIGLHLLNREADEVKIPAPPE